MKWTNEQMNKWTNECSNSQWINALNIEDLSHLSIGAGGVYG